MALETGCSEGEPFPAQGRAEVGFRMGIVRIHPAVFVSFDCAQDRGVARHDGQANRGVTGYGAMKNAKAAENKR